MGIFNLFKRRGPKIIVQEKKKEGFDGWLKCPACSEMIFEKEVTKNLNCCPKCEEHFKISAEERVALLADEGSFEEMFENVLPTDPLQFEDSEAYSDRMKRSQEKTGVTEGFLAGSCTMGGNPVMLGVMNFAFMGGSMGSVVGEKITLLIEHATSQKMAVVLVCTSGGARMQESVYSLMQMAKTSAALTRHADAALPYITVLTHPTTGGVTASFASLGDVIIAEPNALIGFAGPRVIEQTMKQKLPEKAQRAEFLIEKGMVDCISRRKELKKDLIYFIELFTGNHPATESMAQKLDHLVEISKKTREKNTVTITR